MQNNQTTPLTQYPIAEELNQCKKNIESTSLAELFANDKNRFQHYHINDAGLLLDYSKHWINKQIIKALVTMAEQSYLKDAITAMFKGDAINHSENRPALHTALRYFGQTPIFVKDQDITQDIRQVRIKIKNITTSIHSGNRKGFTGEPIKNIVNIGIGGSYLGLKTVTDALTPFRNNSITLHYIANIDPDELVTVLKRCSPNNTLFIVASKSFSTQETLYNAVAAKKWILQSGCPEQDINKHFIAISNNIAAAETFGISTDNILPLWDWVGGRYSLWSAIGLVISISLGYTHFERLLQGGHAMDNHFRNSPLNKNMPVIMGLLGIWYQNWFGAQNQGILPYSYFLRTLPKHLQQLDMESNGKHVQQNGLTVNYQTGVVVWGGTGTNGQHAYHQLLHQGNILAPIDFIVATNSHNPVEDHQTWLFAHALAQSRAMMLGQPLQDELSPHKFVPGNRPNSLILMESLTPETLGALIALYEHKVFVQGHIWGINSFDQWGVELGKNLSNTIYSYLKDYSNHLPLDSSTDNHIKIFHQHLLQKNKK